MSELKLIDDKTAKKLVKNAGKWVDESRLYSSSRSVVKHAIAEYEANQLGFTLYEMRAGKKESDC